ncbi:hypothetical protein SDC9_207345 [bioreactor metagenome]|uniref:Uncharacterized protein n=1 Tax=bioreactor metagenome TaxID=1076179 RepID=A0A645JGZ1_9ZZZZ
MKTVPLAVGSHAGRPFAFFAAVRQIFRGGRLVRRFPVDDRVILFERNAFAHVRDHFVGHQDDRRAVPLGVIERGNGQLVHLADGGGTNADHGMIPVCAPLGLHDVSLRRGSGKPGGRAHAHDARDDDRHFRNGGVSDQLLL